MSDELTKRAIRAYLKAGGQDQPGSASGLEVRDGKQFLVLRNAKGTLATYAVTKGRLRRVRE